MCMLDISNNVNKFNTSKKFFFINCTFPKTKIARVNRSYVTREYQTLQ